MDSGGENLTNRELELERRIQELEAQNADLFKALCIDALTKAQNRFGFENSSVPKIKQHITQNRDLAVVFSDINFFKAINDHYDHFHGDFILQAMSYAMEQYGREDEYFAFFRSGGDEFIRLFTSGEIGSNRRVFDPVGGIRRMVQSVNETLIKIGEESDYGVMYPVLSDEDMVKHSRNNSEEYKKLQNKPISFGGGIVTLGEYRVDANLLLSAFSVPFLSKAFEEEREVLNPEEVSELVGKFGGKESQALIYLTSQELAQESEILRDYFSSLDTAKNFRGFIKYLIDNQSRTREDSFANSLWNPFFESDFQDENRQIQLRRDLTSQIRGNYDIGKRFTDASSRVLSAIRKSPTYKFLNPNQRNQFFNKEELFNIDIENFVQGNIGTGIFLELAMREAEERHSRTKENPNFGRGYFTLPNGVLVDVYEPQRRIQL